MIRRIFTLDWLLGFLAFGIAYFAGIINGDSENILVRLGVLFVAIMLFQYVLDKFAEGRGGRKPRE